MTIKETIKYTVELDTAQLSEQLSQFRQQVDSAISSSPISNLSTMSAGSLQNQAIQNQSMIQSIMDRTESMGMKQLEQLKSDNFSFRYDDLPESFSQRSALENALGAVVGLGYDPSSSRMSMGEYMRESKYNFAVRIPLIGTEIPDNLKLANYLRKVSKGSLASEFSLNNSLSLATNIRNLDLNPEFVDQDFSRPEIMGLVSTMASQGDFVSVESPAEMQEKIVSAMRSVRTVMQTMRQTMEEAVQTQSAIRSLGVDETNIGMFSSSIKGLGSAGGLSALEMLATAQTGGQLSSAMGIHPLVGGTGLMNSLLEYRVGGKSDDIDSWRIRAMGGEMGAAVETAKAAQRINSSPYGMYLLSQGRSINSYGDYADLVVEGMQEAAGTPQEVTWKALGGMADIWTSLGENATPQRIALLAEQQGLMPYNTAWTQMQAAANVDWSERSATAVKSAVATDAVGASQIEMGGLYGETQNWFTSGKRYFRDLGSTLDVSMAAREIKSSFNYNVLKGFTVKELDIPDYRTVDSARLNNMINLYDPLMERSIKLRPEINTDYERLIFGNMYDVNSAVGGLMRATGITDKGALTGLFSDDGKIDEILDSVEGIDEEGRAAIKDSMSSYLYAVGAEYGQYALKDASQKLDALTLTPKRFKSVVEDLAVVYKHQTKAESLASRISNLSDLEKNMFLGGGGLEKELIAKLYDLAESTGFKVRVATDLADAEKGLEIPTI